ncbi:MAG: YlxR family protein [Ilumatobacteraceae bacterium]
MITPIRSCVGCRARRPAVELLRCVVDDSGMVSVSRTAGGRGAWICGSGCLAAARRSRGFQRAWRCDVGDEVFDGLADTLEGWGRTDVVRESDDEVRE